MLYYTIEYDERNDSNAQDFFARSLSVRVRTSNGFGF